MVNSDMKLLSQKLKSYLKAICKLTCDILIMVVAQILSVKTRIFCNYMYTKSENYSKRTFNDVEKPIDRSENLSYNPFSVQRFAQNG